VTIVHVKRGCHVWLYRGTQTARLTVKLRAGGTLSITNNDVMPHKLVKTSGPAVRFVGKRAMSHMSASVKVRFGHGGVYKFVTKAGEDYAGMDMKTVGEDNVLRLVVRVVS
jgi:plastocyanin